PGIRNAGERGTSLPRLARSTGGCMRTIPRLPFSVILLLTWTTAVPAEMSAERLTRIDAVGRRAVAQGELPGAVVLIVHRDKVVFRKAYGLRSKKPAETPMTVDTVFDLASLTKPVATATSVMLLLEEGKLSLSDRVAQHLRGFGKNGKGKITIEQLMLHTSGLLADNAVADYRDGRAKALERIYALKPLADPGARFIYSDVNYILL